MKIKEVEIKHFKSIISTKFPVQEDLTALVGANESGKSNVIQALIDFFSDSDFSTYDRHRLSHDDPEITITFSLSKEESLLVSEVSGDKVNDTLIIRKSGPSKEVLNIDFAKEQKKTPERVGAKLSVPIEMADDTEEVNAGDEKFQPQEQIKKAAPIGPKETVKTRKEKILNMLPRIIPVKSVEDLITERNFLIKELADTIDQQTGELSTVNAFLHLGEFTFPSLRARKTTLEEKTRELLTASAKIGKKIRGVWKQEDIKIVLSSDKKYISILVRDGGCLPEKPIIKRGMTDEDIKRATGAINTRENDTNWVWTSMAERSLGFRWYTAFYSKFISKTEDEGTNNTVLIIDDLGLFLNASIQQILYSKLLRNSQKKAQIIYSTHSPYMLNFRDKEKILLVEKREKGSKVIPDWLQSRRLRALPKPLRDIGVTRSENILQTNNLLIEGSSDEILIKRLLELFDADLTTEFKNSFEMTNYYHVGGYSEAVPVALYCKNDEKRAVILLDSDKKALDEKQRALSYDLEVNDIHTLSKPYKTSAFKIETVEDLIPDKIYLIALNEIGNRLYPDKWEDLIKIVRKKKDRPALGILKAVMQRLANYEFSKDELEKIKNSKKATLQLATQIIERKDYGAERTIAVKNFLINLAKLID